MYKNSVSIFNQDFICKDLNMVEGLLHSEAFGSSVQAVEFWNYLYCQLYKQYRFGILELVVIFSNKYFVLFFL